MAGLNGVAWFEVGTDDPAAAQKFYGEVFGWSVGHDEGDGPRCQMFTVGGEGPGLCADRLFGTGGVVPGYAVFGVLVEYVPEAVRRVEKAGGSARGRGDDHGRDHVRAPARPGGQPVRGVQHAAEGSDRT